MKSLRLTKKKENHIIALGIIAYWWFFWLLNVVDKFIGQETFLWVGKDRMAQFLDYFSSIGVYNPDIAIFTLVVITVLQLTAFVFATLALYMFFEGNKKESRGAFFYTILFSLIVFSVFAIGDQIFGDRFELMEHTIYWISLVISWFVFVQVE